MNKEQKFWDWFVKNCFRYDSFNQIGDETLKENLLNEMLEHLHHYSERLYFEIGGGADEPQELVISAAGNEEYFVEVEKLVAEAPSMFNWRFVAFKQPADSLFVTQYDGLFLDPELMWFMPLDNEKDPGALGLIVYVEKYAERHKPLYIAGVLQVLDTLLGEKSAALEIHYVDVNELPRNPKERGLIELVDLPEYISWRRKTRASF